ncbi:MAG: signal peptidase I [Bacilli bacterium]
MEKIKNNKFFKIGSIVFKVIIFIVMIGFILSVCLQRFSNNKLSIFNYRMFTVISGSMEPKYKIGDVLLAKEIAPEKIKVGDIISYLGNVNSFKDKVVTHQVVGIDKIDGKYYFHTKGLANLVEDPLVSADQLYGKVIYKSVIISLIYKIVSTNVGFYLFIIIPILYIISSEIISTLLDKEEKKINKD